MNPVAAEREKFVQGSGIEWKFLGRPLNFNEFITIVSSIRRLPSALESTRHTQSVQKAEPDGTKLVDRITSTNSCRCSGPLLASTTFGFLDPRSGARAGIIVD